MAQPFLKTGKQRFLIARLNMDHPVRIEPSLRKRWCEEIGPSYDPKHFASGPRRNPRREHSRGRTVNRSITAPCNLMQASEAQSSSW